MCRSAAARPSRGPTASWWVTTPRSRSSERMDGRRPLRRSDVYKRAVVDGRELRDNPLARLKRQFSAARTSAREREEAALEGELRSHPGVSRANTIAVISPKGGVGKTTCAFLLGNLLCSHLGMRVVATADQVTADQVLGSLRHIDHDRTTLVLNQARERGGGHRSVAVPRDERLRTMLDTGTYSLEALRPDTRMAVKQLGLAVAEQIS